MNAQAPELSPIAFDSFDSVIFDLGGVLLPLYPAKTVDAFSAHFGRDASDLYTQAHQSHLFDEFERGEISPEVFRARLTAEGPALKDSELDQAWNAMLGRLPREHLSFLKELGATKRVFLLSNTNAIHVACFLAHFEEDHGKEFGAFSSLFETAHYSHDLKMRKPEARIYQELITRHQLAPDRTLFIDDNLDNIRAAVGVGLQGIHHPTNAPLVPRFTR